MKKIIQKGLLGAVMLLSASLSFGQNTEKATVDKIVADKNFIFVPQMMNPMRGPSRQLNGDFDLRVSGDTLVSYLPYFGRAYTAPVNSQDGGLDFTSTDFEYQTVASKKDGWDITIKPKDSQSARQLSFRVFDDGTASLQVTSNARESISFNGYISEGKIKK